MTCIIAARRHGLPVGQSKRFVMTLFSLVAGVCGAAAVNPSDPMIQFVGRWDLSDPSRPWCQAKSSSISLTFEGTRIAVEVDGDESDYLRTIIDGNAAGSVKFRLSDGLNILAEDLEDTTHTLELVKETDAGRLHVLAVRLDEGKALVAPPERPPRRITFYGDSNQAGYSLESERNEAGRRFEGAYYTYPGIVARMFDASITCRSAMRLRITCTHSE